MTKRTQRTLAWVMLAAFLSGCSHTLDVKNLAQYRASSTGQLQQPITIGLVSTTSEPDTLDIVRWIADGLNRNSAKAITPYYPGRGEPQADVVARVDITPRYKGSWVNFFINWPGYLIWTPAWNGYVYKADYDIDVHLSDQKSGAALSDVRVPIHYNIRHADINRTWTEISWFEIGIIAFIGGLIFIQYDDGITPNVMEKVGPRIGAYVADRIVGELGQYKPQRSS